MDLGLYERPDGELDDILDSGTAVHVAWSVRAVGVIVVVKVAITRYGKPGQIHGTSAPAFTAKALQEILDGEQAKPLSITPGAPWGNGLIESFHDKFREDCLEREVFGSRLESGMILEQYRKGYTRTDSTARLANGLTESILRRVSLILMDAARPQTLRRLPRQRVQG